MQPGTLTLSSNDAEFSKSKVRTKLYLQGAGHHTGFRDRARVPRAQGILLESRRK